jgi:glycosyltransferase involved in cell wall biosynthesis
MKILWIKSDFLHPTTRGGQIRTLEMLRRLHAGHEIHYVALDHANEAEGRRRSGEYSRKAYGIPHYAPSRRSLRFVGQLVWGLLANEPVSISRYRSRAMRRLLENLMGTEDFDCVVCDFLSPAVNVPDLNGVVLFQHNVETVIWERHAAVASNSLTRWYLRRQADKMRAFEQGVCTSVAHIVAVSEADASLLRERFGASSVSAIPTGVDVSRFTPPSVIEPDADCVFLGSMDWLPNIDGVVYFVNEVLPIIRRTNPSATLTIVGRRPGPEIRALAHRDRGITVTGTVDDVRPYLWRSRISVVPLRVGGGTRLKIFEAMAAKVPVVSTTIGAEGLDVLAPDHIRLADTPEGFAGECVALLNSAEQRKCLADAAWDRVSKRFSWDAVVREFEDTLTTFGKNYR